MSHTPITGGCLCGAVRFEVTEIAGPLELCHCPKCRKVSGGPWMAGVVVATAGYRLLADAEDIRYYERPLEHHPPAYGVHFCRHCGSPVPPPEDQIEGERFELAAGLFDEPLEIAPDRHIFVEHQASWYPHRDSLPRFTAAEIRAWRKNH